MRRILIFSLVYYPRFIGGAEVAVKEITDRISPDDIVFDMITGKLSAGLASVERIGNVNIHRVGISSPLDKIFFPIFGTIRALQLLSKNQYDAFWAMMVTYSSGVPYVVNILRKMTGKKPIPTILTLQEGDSEEHIKNKSFGIAGLFWRIVLLPVIILLPGKFRRLGLIGLSWALALKRTSRLTVISNYLGRQAREYGFSGDISLIPNAVDTRHFSALISEQDERALKERLDKKDGDIFLVTTSRLVEKNGIKDIISALPYLPAQVKLLILGTGPLESSLKKQATDLELGGRVRFVGFVPHKDMPSYLHVSDIFIRPSLSEGLGNSFLEAMAAGLPVIATPVGGIPDFLVDGETGLFCEVNNPRSIAQKVEKLMKDRESRDYVVKNAKRMVEDRYEWGKIARQMKDVLLSSTARQV